LVVVAAVAAVVGLALLVALWRAGQAQIVVIILPLSLLVVELRVRIEVVL
jgi:hypothetical protein